MPVAYNEKKDTPFAVGYFSKIGESGCFIEFEEATIIPGDENFYYIIGHCVGWDIVNYDDKHFQFEAQLLSLRCLKQSSEYTWKGETKKRIPSYSELALWDYVNEHDLTEKPLKLEIDFGSKGETSAGLWYGAKKKLPEGQGS